MRQTSLFVMLLAAPHTLLADNVLEQASDDIVITASRAPISTNKMTSFAEVITDLGDNASPQLSVGQQLDGVGGISFTTNGVRGSQSGLQMGGLSSKYNKVYLDGFNLADPAAISA
jgi:Outer membrane cobalamin receptor protein